MRVLVVSEDAAERRRAASALLLHADAEVVEMDSGEDARMALIDGDVVADVLVVDADLWPRGGFALLYDLQQRATQTGTTLPPSIVLTSREQDRFLVSWSRADASLRKPVDPFDLARTVAGLHTTEQPTGDGAPA